MMSKGRECVAKLKARPLVDGLPLHIGSLELSVVQNETITAVLFSGNAPSELSVEPGRVKDTPYGRLVWSARNQAFLFGQAGDCDGCYSADISDGWVFFALKGEGSEDVLARLVPLDLRKSKVPEGRSFRTQLRHMEALIVTTSNGFEMGVMSSYAVTAKREIEEAMRTIAALNS